MILNQRSLSLCGEGAGPSVALMLYKVGFSCKAIESLEEGIWPTCGTKGTLSDGNRFSMQIVIFYGRMLVVMACGYISAPALRPSKTNDVESGSSFGAINTFSIIGPTRDNPYRSL